MNGKNDNERKPHEFKNDVLTAQTKFGVIAPIIQGLFPDVTKTAYYKRISEKPLQMPNGKCAKFNYNTFEKWEQAYRKSGFDGLCPKGRSDAGIPRKLSEAAIAEIYRLKELFPRANATLIYNKLIIDGVIMEKDTSISTIQRFFRKNNLKGKSFAMVNTKDRKAFEEDSPCMMYQADTSHTIYITENGEKRKTYLIHIVDDNTRLIVGARFFYEDNAYNFQKVLKEAVSRFGLCTKLYVDHGGPYENEQLTKICIAAGIVKIHAPVRDGAAKD